MKEKIKYKQIGAIACIGVLIIIGLSYAVFKDASVKNQTSVNLSKKALEFSETNFDFGNVNINAGTVSHEYILKNTNNTAITITGMKTSCMCTNVIMQYKDRTSPTFGMHNNPSFYSQTIQPGETAKIIATFDPLFHGPNGTGNVTRIVDINTNTDNYQIRFTANVTK